MISSEMKLTSEIEAVNFEQNGFFTEPELAAKLEPFDSFWEGPKDVEKGYKTFAQFYKSNYLKYLPQNKQASILVISCGPGYFVNLLNQEGYKNVLGIDSFPEKIKHAQQKKLNCQVARAFPFLKNSREQFDIIICEQELNHLTKAEMMSFLKLCWDNLKTNGTLVVHGLNGANPLVGSETLAQNIDHFNTFTEYSLRQVLDYNGFDHIKVLPLNLYVFYNNPFNYVALLITTLYTFFFRFNFILYGKSNKIFTKKIGGVAQKSSIRLPGQLSPNFHD